MEITRKNFNKELDNITKNLSLSCFIGFDAEFTAILARECFKHRLFDTTKDRYDKIKNEVSKMIMSQVGLTLFQYDRNLDSYVAVEYTFHLCPQVFSVIDQSLIFQASTLKFLCKNNFNFNKFTYDGLPYLSKTEENVIRQQIQDKVLFENLIDSMDMVDEKILQGYCSQVSKWLTTGEDCTLYLDIETPVMRYLVHNEVRERFPEVLTTDSLGNSNKVLIYKDKYVEGATAASMSTLEENLMKSVLGFSQIINLLAQYQKPIVGHNIFLDAILLHNQFIGPLPKSYCVFKNNIHNLFPIMFDTKYISHEMRNKLTFDEMWKSNTLQDLYEFFSERKCKKLEVGVNSIKLSTPFGVKQSYHEAGWDSYCSGYCFIRLGHWAACEITGKYMSVGPARKMAALAPYCNKINVIRGAVPYMSLVDDDPPSHRPDLLHIKSMKGRVINLAVVASMFSSFGAVDVKPYGTKTALIAAGTHHTADRILKQFKNSKEYRISPYCALKHSPAGRVTLWGSAILTGGIFLYYIHKRVNE